MSLVVIDDLTTVPAPPIDPHTGKPRAMGLIPRPLTEGWGKGVAGPLPFKLIDRDEWKDRLAEQEKNESSLYHIRKKAKFGQMMPSLDQDSYGYCWGHSPVTCMQLSRGRDNQPWVDLSAFSVAAPIKNYQNEGGWNTQALAYLVKHGCCTSKTWPQQQCKRSLDNEESRAERALYRADEWADLDPDYMMDMLVTCLLLNIPVAGDHNWWGHSIAHARLKAILGSRPRDFRIRTTILNSWGDGWSEYGMGDLEGDRAIPNAATALLTSYAAKPTAAQTQLAI